MFRARPPWLAFFVTLILLSLPMGSTEAQPTTTIITHGFQLTGDFPAWVVDMGIAIAQQTPAGTPQGTVLVYDALTGTWSPVFGPEDPAGPLILTYDWSDDSAWLPGTSNANGTALAAADALYATLRDPNVTGLLQGISFLETGTSALRPLHFIGHSRGTVVNSETVRRLVLDGIPVDHVTTLDPHPIGPSPDLLDADPVTWEGVVWADNYWRADGCDLDDSCVGFDFDGREIVGAANLDLQLDALGPGDNRLFTCTLEHILVHTWYHGTIDLSAADDGSCTIERTDWYTNLGDQEGFFFAQGGGGAAQRPCGPQGGCSDAGRVVPTAVPRLANGDFEFGSGQDAGWFWHGGGGNGMILEELGNAFLQLEPAGISRTHDRFFLDGLAGSLRLDYRVVSADPQTTLEVVLTDAGNADFFLLVLDADTTTGWMQVEVPIPATIPREQTYTLTVFLGGATPAATVDVDNILILEASDPPFLRGDCNSDSSMNVADAVAALDGLFGMSPPSCASACDHNDDGAYDIADPIALLLALFGSAGPLPPPQGVCGVDPTPDSLDCSVPPLCP